MGPRWSRAIDALQASFFYLLLLYSESAVSNCQLSESKMAQQRSSAAAHQNGGGATHEERGASARGAECGTGQAKLGAGRSGGLGGRVQGLEARRRHVGLGRVGLGHVGRAGARRPGVGDVGGAGGQAAVAGGRRTAAHKPPTMRPSRRESMTPRARLPTIRRTASHRPLQSATQVIRVWRL
jgi:hypothetical protein